MVSFTESCCKSPAWMAWLVKALRTRSSRPCARVFACNPLGDPAAHIMQREEQGMRPGGFGLLLAGGIVDELIYSEIGNEVLLIKYVDSTEAVES